MPHAHSPPKSNFKMPIVTVMADFFTWRPPLLVLEYIMVSLLDFERLVHISNFGHFPTRKQASHYNRSNLEGSLIFLACPLELELRFTPDRLLLYEISLGSGLIFFPCVMCCYSKSGKQKGGLDSHPESSEEVEGSSPGFNTSIPGL